MIKKNFIQYLRTEKNYSSHTEISYITDLTQLEDYIIETVGEFDPASVDKDLIRGWVIQMTEDGIKPRSINRKLSAIKTFYRYLQKTGTIGVNPVEGITGPKTPKNLPTYISHKEIKGLLNSETIFTEDFEGIRDRFIIEILYATGMRRAELAGLQNSDIDLHTKNIKVAGKRNKERIIPISKQTAQSLYRYIESRNENIKNISPYLLVNKSGEGLKPSAIYNIVNKYLENIPTISKRSPHVLRHSFATEMLNSGADISAVKEIMGHNSLSSTEIYTHVTFKELQKTYNNAHPRAKK